MQINDEDKEPFALLIKVRVWRAVGLNLIIGGIVLMAGSWVSIPAYVWSAMFALAGLGNILAAQLLLTRAKGILRIRELEGTA